MACSGCKREIREKYKKKMAQKKAKKTSSAAARHLAEVRKRQKMKR